jgi:DNA-binding transcriptional LysR family regulator
VRSATPERLVAATRPLDTSQMELRQLQYFVVLAEEQHFSRAAKRIGIEQSPLSRAIRALERDLGVVLLDRSTRGSRLTPAGDTFFRHARLIILAIESARTATLSVAQQGADSMQTKLKADSVAIFATPEIRGPDR